MGRPAAGAAALQMGAAAGIRGGGGGELRIGARAGARGASAAEVCARGWPARASVCARVWTARAALPGRASVSVSAGGVRMDLLSNPPAARLQCTTR